MEWYSLSLTFRWPHEAILLGFELFEPTKRDPFNTIRLHLLLITINFDFGDDLNTFE